VAKDHPAHEVDPEDPAEMVSPDVTADPDPKDQADPRDHPAETELLADPATEVTQVSPPTAESDHPASPAGPDPEADLEDPALPAETETLALPEAPALPATMDRTADPASKAAMANPATVDHPDHQDPAITAHQPDWLLAISRSPEESALRSASVIFALTVATNMRQKQCGHR
jgi:hypothetical protein